MAQGAAKEGVTSRWEWVAAGAGALLILGTVGVLLYEGLALPATPPSLQVSVDSVVATPHAFLVQVTAHNHGRRTAATVTLEGVLYGDAGVLETATTTVDFVPGAASRGAGLLFTRDPREHRLHVRATGFEVP